MICFTDQLAHVTAMKGSDHKGMPPFFVFSYLSYFKSLNAGFNWPSFPFSNAVLFDSVYLVLEFILYSTECNQSHQKILCHICNMMYMSSCFHFVQICWKMKRKLTSISRSLHSHR